ncbi:hypothetical protein GPL15_11080 [Clostridium sp. MCC353]|nr:hypothetical protein [Clostridium sp. MCC353]
MDEEKRISFPMIRYLRIVEKKSEDNLMVSFGNKRRRKCNMKTLKVLTLVLVIFAVLWKAFHNTAAAQKTISVSMTSVEVSSIVM